MTNGTTFVFSTNNPALNLNPCKVIWNFYPVDDNGNYLPNGEFTLIRRTANQLGGFTLAPRGNIKYNSIHSTFILIFGFERSYH